MSNSPTKTTSLAHSVYCTIKKMIHDREISPGERLIERNLAHQLNVSRVPIREALVMLRKEGLIFDKPDVGVCVVEICRDTHNQFLDVLNALDTLIARRVFERVTPELLQRLKKNITDTQSFVEKNEMNAAYAACLEFHAILRAAADYPYLENLCQQTEFLMTWHLPKETAVIENYETHKRIYNALESEEFEVFLSTLLEHNNILAETFDAH